MKKFDKEYSTQYTPEKKYLLKVGIKPSYVKIIDGITTYKYTKSPELFLALVSFYMDKDNNFYEDNIQVIKNEKMDN